MVYLVKDAIYISWMVRRQDRDSVSLFLVWPSRLSPACTGWQSLSVGTTGEILGRDVPGGARDNGLCLAPNHISPYYLLKP